MIPGIASRVIKPLPGQAMRQMIDNLCMKEKSFIYANPNFREDCIGTQNTIFDLSGSHLVNRPGVLVQEERQATKNLEQISGAAAFSGASFLAGQKANMYTYTKDEQNDEPLTVYRRQP